MLVGILTHTQDELERNYNSIQEALAGSLDEHLETAVYEAGWDGLRQALNEYQALLDLLRDCRGQITTGLQVRLTRPLQSDADMAVVSNLWCGIGRAIVEIDRWLEAHHQSSSKLTEEDCRYRTMTELLAGWPSGPTLRLMREWRDFRDHYARNQIRSYSLEEIGVTTMYAEPDREINLREVARRDYTDQHCFELEAGVYEYCVSPGVRILFAVESGTPVPLDVLQLFGRHVDGWSPRRLVRRAQCRLAARRHARGR